MSAGDVTVTATPGITAPCASVTMPVSRPCVICAVAGIAPSIPSNVIAPMTTQSLRDLICALQMPFWLPA